jgi:hypothetical protein
MALSNQKMRREAARSPRNPRQESATFEAGAISSETVILYNKGKRSAPLDLTEQRIKGRYGVCAEKENGKPTGTMIVIQVFVSLQHLKETKWSVCNPVVSSIMQFRCSQFIGTDMQTPSVRNQMLLLQNKSIQ